MDSKKVLTAVVVILALALLGSLIWGFGKNSDAKELQADNTEVNEALDAMTSLRDNLAREVDSLAGEYDLLASENVHKCYMYQFQRHCYNFELPLYKSDLQQVRRYLISHHLDQLPHFLALQAPQQLFAIQ